MILRDALKGEIIDRQSETNNTMPVEEVKAFEGRNVLVGIRFDGQARELLDWALVKVADPGDCVVALHICRNSGTFSMCYL
jgi:hypothetical protein